MKYLSVAQTAKKWNISERSVRNYCAEGRVGGAFLTGKTWNIPEGAQKPGRANGRARSGALLRALRAEKSARLSGGIYHKVQVELTYNSDHIEGSRLTHEQTRFIFETKTVEGGAVFVDDVVETVNHFECVDAVIDCAEKKITQAFIKRLHGTLMRGTSQAREKRFAVGEYKKLPNTVGDIFTALPEEVEEKMGALIEEYNGKKPKTLDDILDFHCKFERIHPFQDGNGRVGRLLMFKECLNCGIVPFIIDEQLKPFYYRGLREWGRERGFLRDTCLAAQDKFKEYLDYFRIEY